MFLSPPQRSLFPERRWTRSILCPAENVGGSHTAQLGGIPANQLRPRKVVVERRHEQGSLGRARGDQTPMVLLRSSHSALLRWPSGIRMLDKHPQKILTTVPHASQVHNGVALSTGVERRVCLGNLHFTWEVVGHSSTGAGVRDRQMHAGENRG